MSRSAPPNAGHVGLVSGSTISRSRRPSGRYLRIRPPPNRHTHTPPSASTVRPSGKSVGRLDVGEHSLPTELAGVEVVLELGDALGRAVDVVHRGAVRAPADSVGDRPFRQHLGQLVAGVEPIQRRLSGLAIAVKRSRPQPPTRVGTTVVEPHTGLGSTSASSVHRRRCRHATTRIPRPTSSLRPHTARPHRHRPRVANESPHGHRVPSVHEPAGDVDADQLTGAVVPHRSLAELVGAEHAIVAVGGGLVRHQRIVF